MCYLVFEVGQFGAFLRRVEIWIIKWRVKSSAIHPDIHLSVTSSDSTPLHFSWSAVGFMCVFHLTGVLGRQQVPHRFESSGTRTVIGVTVGIVVLVVSFVAVLYYFKHKRKHFHVSKTDENNSHDAGSESKFSTLPSATNESLKEPLSPSASPGKRDKKRSPKIKLPMKNFLPKRMRETSRCSVDCV